VRDVLPTGDVDAAYAVQAALIAHRTAGGARAVGRKIGLTSPKVQAQLGVSQPDFGVLLDDMACAQDQPVDITRLIQPKIEAELAFILATDLDQASVSEADVAAATAHVVAALEIVDSRIAGWDISNPRHRCRQRLLRPVRPRRPAGTAREHRCHSSSDDPPPRRRDRLGRHRR
jgi:2-keto-4-pentenoate hydratase